MTRDNNDDLIITLANLLNRLINIPLLTEAQEQKLFELLASIILGFVSPPDPSE